ncbi:MAG TPA: TylF/MycF/NovP-related O-methyltransferase [bacterium]|nr:TylF/MycF/NovP-related O-methyltransferase [bacterium]
MTIRGTGRISRFVASGVRVVARQLGLDVVPYYRYPPDFDPELIQVIERVGQYTKSTPEQAFALCHAVRYVIRARVPGAIVECGVWRGGSMMAAAYTLLLEQDASRDLYLFDTFEGMPPPSRHDVRWDGAKADRVLAESDRADEEATWAAVSIDKVRGAMRSTGYDEARVHYVAGLVEETIPQQAPASIALLRLDTDWYASTKHELQHLFPRISRGGVLIIDDYGYWQGARRAVDEYFRDHRINLLLNRLGPARMCVVPDQGLN